MPSKSSENAVFLPPLGCCFHEDFGFCHSSVGFPPHSSKVAAFVYASVSCCALIVGAGHASNSSFRPCYYIIYCVPRASQVELWCCDHTEAVEIIIDNEHDEVTK